jgi:chitinase
MVSISGGVTYSVNPSGADIENFDPTRDKLDFGDTSVHGLILGKLSDGSAIIVNPWGTDDYQRILDSNGNALRWDQLSLDNFAPVGNEHLRADIGGVLSWELQVGPEASWPSEQRTVYIRSHEYGVQERIENFDPTTDKLNFLYLGTRERLTATDTDEGLLIAVEPSGQSVLLAGVNSKELIGQNLEFHFDQIEEDNLETVFGFEASDLTLADRSLLLTPEAPEGATTDGYQTRVGSLVTSTGAVALDAPVHNHTGAEHEGIEHGGMVHGAMSNSTMATSGSLTLAASGSLYWGGMGGTLTITNTGSEAVENWSVTFDTPHSNFQSWSGEVTVETLASGIDRVTLTPASWNNRIGAGESLEVSFNAISEGLPNSGALTSSLFFASGQELVLEPSTPAEPVETTPPEEQLVVEETLQQPTVSLPQASDMRVVGYFEEWGIYSRDFQPSDIQADQLTHLNYSFFDVKASGDVILFDSYAATEKRFSQDQQVKRTFSSGDWDTMDASQKNNYLNNSNFVISDAGGTVTVQAVPQDWNTPGALAGNLRQLELLKQLNPELRLGIALGGWTLSDEFSLAVDSAADREAFTNSIVDTLSNYDFFNVVDFDWEYPGGGGLAGNAVNPQDGANFAATLELLRLKLNDLSLQTGETYEISVATAGGADKLANLNLDGIDPYVDFYNVMAYDFHGGWESVTGHQAALTGDPGGFDIVNAVGVFDNAGVDRDKVVLGAPAYTRAWGGVQAGDSYGYQQNGDALLAAGSFEAGNYDHKDLITGIEDESYDLIWDDDAKAAFAYNNESLVWSSIETTATIAGKAAYVQEAGLGGMMFWALSNDSQDEQSLVAAASDILLGGVAPEEVIAQAPTFDAVTGGDGAFTIADFTGLA